METMKYLVGISIPGFVIAGKSNDLKLNLTFDEWTSTAKKLYININLNSADKFFNLGLIRI